MQKQMNEMRKVMMGHAELLAASPAAPLKWAKRRATVEMRSFEAPKTGEYARLDEWRPRARYL